MRKHIFESGHIHADDSVQFGNLVKARSTSTSFFFLFPSQFRLAHDVLKPRFIEASGTGLGAISS